MIFKRFTKSYFWRNSRVSDMSFKIQSSLHRFASEGIRMNKLSYEPAFHDFCTEQFGIEGAPITEEEWKWTFCVWEIVQGGLSRVSVTRRWNIK